VGTKARALSVWAVALIVAGCLGNDPTPITTVASAPAFLIDEDSRTHHFGAIVSRPGKTLIHRFRLANATDHPVRLAQVINRKSCCGEIQVGATTIPPGGSTDVAVTLMVGNKFGDVVHETEVVTDPPSPGEIVLRLVAQAVPALRVEATSADAPSYLVGAGPQTVEFLVTANGTETEPPIDLDRLTLSPPGEARWLGPKRDASSEESANAVSRRFAATLNPAGPVGERSTVYGLRDGPTTVHEHLVRWEVVPALTVSPRVAILSSGSREARLVIRARDGRPFRVTRIESKRNGLSGTCANPESSAAQTIVIKADPGLAAGSHGLTIFTEHPNQATVVVAVLIQE